jgi:NOL1/NOP2/fmu family ribosome biogenesis protein
MKPPFLHVLNSREKRDVVKVLHDQFGGTPVFGALLENRDGKIYVISEDLATIPLDKLRLEGMGMALGRRHADGLRLSIEGSQVVGPHATHHILEISSDQLDRWLAGESVDCEADDGFYLLKCGDDFVGSAKCKNHVLLNAVPKGRRLLERI